MFSPQVRKNCFPFEIYLNKPFNVVLGRSIATERNLHIDGKNFNRLHYLKTRMNVDFPEAKAKPKKILFRIRN